MSSSVEHSSHAYSPHVHQVDPEKEKMIQMKHEQRLRDKKLMEREREKQMCHALSHEYSWSVKTVHHLLRHFQSNLKLEKEAEAGRLLEHTLLYESDEEAAAAENALGAPTKEETFHDFRAYAEGVHTLLHFGNPEQKLQFLFYAYAQDHEDLISRTQLEQLVTGHCKPKRKDDEDDAERYTVKIYTWIKGKFKKFASKEKGTLMTYEDTVKFLQKHPTILDDMTINIDKYTDHFHEVEHKRKVAAILLGRSRSGSNEAIKFQ